jgi:hypothetical protein
VSLANELVSKKLYILSLLLLLATPGGTTGRGEIQRTAFLRIKNPVVKFFSKPLVEVPSRLKANSRNSGTLEPDRLLNALFALDAQGQR